MNELATRLEIKRLDLIEKDVILHFILHNLSEDNFFSQNFAFKGGTCLIKCYFGYVRFSEDIDFTWKNQSDLECKSQKKVREILSRTIDVVGNVFEKITSQLDLEFKNDKANKRFFEISGSNKSCTLKIWYKSEVLNRESFLKVQVNFVERLCFPFKERTAKSLLSKRDRELDLLFPEFSKYSIPVKIPTYDIKEILAEKVRAMLTRRGTKARDFLDIYMIHKTYGLDPADVRLCILQKMEVALNLYERFRTNLREKIKLLDSNSFFGWGAERELLIKEINEKEFYSYLEELQSFVKKLVLSFEGKK